MRNTNSLPPAARAQTLDRGLAALELVAASERPLSVDDVAGALGLHRSIAYRLVRTLEDRRLVERDGAGRYSPGVRLAVLARGARAPLRSAATGELAALADRLQMTAFVVVRDGDEALTLDAIEPRRTDVHVSYRPGTRHAVDRGAPGLALLAGGPVQAGERREVATARRRGWAHTRSEVLAGMAAVAAPIGSQGAVAVLWLDAQPVVVATVAAEVMRAAAAIAARLS